MKKKILKKRGYGRNHFRFFIVFGFVIIFFAIAMVFLQNRRESCANSISCTKNLSGDFQQNAHKGVFMEKTVFVPESIARNSLTQVVLGDSTNPKRIEVDLTNQKLYAYEGNNRVFDFLISSGKWGQTPTGVFQIWIKLRYTRMEGGSKEINTYYNLPNVPYTMFFYNSEIPKWRGYGIHGAYWHNNFGHPMSHGCINMRIEDAEKLFYFASPPSTASTTYATDESPGTPIVIYGVAPNQ